MKYPLIIVSIVLILLVAPMVSALEFDNIVKDIDTSSNIFIGDKEISYNTIWEKYNPIQIDNIFGLGETLWEGAIDEHTESCGINCYSTITISLPKDGSLIDDVKFLTEQEDESWIEQPIRDYNFYIVDGEKKTLYNQGEEVLAGTYNILLEGEKKPSRTVDWQIETQGKWIDTWAVWGNTNILEDNFNDNTMNYTKWANSSAFSMSFGSASALEQNQRFEMATAHSCINGGGGTASSKLVTNGTVFNYTTITFDSVTLSLSAINPNPYVTNEVIVRVLIGSETIIDKYAADSPGQGTITPVYDDLEAGYTYTLTKNGEDSLLLYKNTTFLREITSIDFDTALTFECSVLTRSSNPNGAGSHSCVFNIDNVNSSNGVVNLNSPIDNQVVQNSPNFNSTAVTVGGATLVNMSLFTNATGSWEVSNSTTRTGTANESILSYTFPSDGSYLWNFQACDSDGDCGVSLSNRTVNIDTANPLIAINRPSTTEDFFKIGGTQVLNWSITESNLDSIWLDYNSTNTTLYGIENQTTFNVEENVYTLKIWANDSVGNINYTQRDWAYKIVEPLRTQNATTIETKQETFSINITANSSLTAANLYFNNTAYAGTQSGEIWTRAITIPTVPGNLSTYWSFTYADDTINSTASNVTVEPLILGLCNATNTIPYINFTFKEEEDTETAQNASIDASTWKYWLGDGSITKSLIFTNVSYNPSYAFCTSPGYVNLSETLDIDFSGDGFPQRKYLRTGILTNSTLNQGLYMLATADGIYTTLSITDTAGTEQSGVSIIVKRSFSGIFNTTDYGTSDDAGTATFWVNPDYTHQFVLTKDGCTDKTYTVTPTLSSYTVEMTCGGGVTSGIEPELFQSYVDGIKWLRTPASGVTKPGVTNFSYYIYARDSNLVQGKFNIINETNSVLGTSTENCNTANCSLSITLNTTNGQRLKGQYYVKTTNSSGNFILLEADAHWIFITSNISDSGTMKSVFINLKNIFSQMGSDANCAQYVTEGTCGADALCKWATYDEGRSVCIPNDQRNKEEYSRFVFLFFIMAFFYALMNKFSNFDSLAPGMVIWFVTIIAWLGSLAGGTKDAGLFYFESFFSSTPGISNSVATTHILNNYFFAIIMTFLLIGLIASRARRDS